MMETGCVTFLPPPECRRFPRSLNSVPGRAPSPEPRRDGERSVWCFSYQRKPEHSPFSSWVHVAFDAVEAARRATGTARRSALSSGRPRTADGARTLARGAICRPCRAMAAPCRTTTRRKAATGRRERPSGRRGDTSLHISPPDGRSTRIRPPGLRCACLPCSTYGSSTPARAKRRAPRPDGPLTHFASPRGETCRLAPDNIFI